MKTAIVLQLLFGLLILFLVLRSIGTAETLSVIASADIYYIALASLAFLAGHFFGAFRISETMKLLGYKVGLLKGATLHYFGMLLSTVTPGRVGYVGISYPLKRMGIGYTASVSYFGVSQVIDVLMKIVFAIASLIGLNYLFGFGGLLEYVVYTMAALGIIGVATLAVLLKVYMEKIEFVMRWVPRFRFLGFVFRKFERVQRFSGEIKSLIPLYMLTALATWFFLGLQWYLIGSAVGMDFPYLVYLFLHPIIGLLFFVPLTPAGLGITESGAVFILGMMGADPAVALSFTLLARVTEIVPSLVGMKALYRP